MKKYWKPFAEWATASRHSVLQRARLKLTGLYVGIIAVILVAFSVTLYYALAKNVRNNLEGNFSSEQTQELVITKTTDELQTSIFFIDALVLLVLGGFSYFLAGKTLKPIQHAMEQQKQFTADASHELRTPLAVIRTNLEVALREKEWNNEKGRMRIAGAINEVQSMTKLTEDLLTLSKLESGETTRSFLKINVAKLVEEVVTKMQGIATERNVQLSIERSDTAWMYGEAGALERLIMNIISNALHFTPANGYVRVAVYTHDGKIMIRVHDTGIGIAKEDLPHVYERLYRADKAREQGGGTGLGLAIAQEIAHTHHGAIHIESEPGKGTLVIITFPAVM